MTEFELYIVLTAVLGVLGLYWLVSDPRPVQERKGDFKDFDTILRRVIQYGLFFVQSYLSVFLNNSRLIGLGTITLIGLFLFISGFILSVWAKVVMRESWGLPATLNKSRQKSLVVTGPFRFTRNPIYVGLLFTGVGYFLTLRSPLIISMIPVAIYFYWAVINEEKLLKKRFGNKYDQYFVKTPRFLFFLDLFSNPQGKIAKSKISRNTVSLLSIQTTLCTKYSENM